MDNKKILFFCNTPYQVLFTINHCFIEKNVQHSIIVTDAIKDFRHMYNKLKQSNIFKYVYIIELNRIKKLNKWECLLAYYAQTYFKKNFIKKYIDFKEVYDELWFANFNTEVTYLRRMLLENNKNLKTIMFEDGFATYSDYYGRTLYDILKPQNVIYSFLRKRIYDNYYHLNAIYVFNAEMMMWNMEEIPVKEIKFLGNNNSDFLEAIYNLYGLEQLKDTYSQKYIYFEESYFEEGKKVNDINLVGRIAEHVGKENIFIKTHPRNKKNRFKEEGYITNQDTIIPWEVLSLFIPLEEKVLLTIASVSVLTPKILLGQCYKGIMLYKIAEPKESLRLDIIPTYEKIRYQFANNVQAPKTINEVLEFL